MLGTRENIKTGLWSAFAGALAMTIAGFWGLGWMTPTNADRLARERADNAVVTALVPFCVVNAEREADAIKLATFRAEESSYKRTQLVTDAGWATLPGTTSPNYALAAACSAKLMGEKTS